MSRSNGGGQGTASPVQKYLDYNGETGNLRFYDKDAKKNIEFEKATFILLDERKSITGFHGKAETTISSNLIKDLKTEAFKVVALKNKNNDKQFTVAEGLWNEDFKMKVNAAGGNFTTNLFALLKVKEGWELVRFELSKSALSGWTDAAKAFKEAGFSGVYDGMIQVTRSEQFTKGKIQYYKPVFTMVPVSEADAALATEADVKLQAYFDEWAGKDAQAAATDSQGDTGYGNPGGYATSVPTQAPQAPQAGIIRVDDDQLPF